MKRFVFVGEKLDKAIDVDDISAVVPPNDGEPEVSYVFVRTKSGCIYRYDLTSKVSEPRHNAALVALVDFGLFECVDWKKRREILARRGL